jgi:hypothetical protein
MRHLILTALLFLPFLATDSLGGIQLASSLEAGSSSAIAVDGNSMLGGLGKNLLSIDATDPTHPIRVGSLALAGHISDILVVGNLAYVATGSDLSIINVSDATSPVLIGREATSGGVGVAVSGAVAYVTGSHALRSIDVSDPAHPVGLGSTPVSNWPYGIRIAGSHAFTAGFKGGLAVIDISSPSAPAQVGAVPGTPIGWDLEVIGQYAYVPRSNGLSIIDITNPSNPFEVGTWLGANGSYISVAVVEGYAYVSGSYGDLEVIDVHDPSHPTGVATSPVLGGYDVAHLANKLFAADGQSSFRIVDISSPTAPTEIGLLPALSSPQAVAIQDGQMFVGESARQTTIDIHDAFAPAWIGTFENYYWPVSVLVPRGPTLFVGRSASILDGGDGGISIFDVSQPASPIELSWKWGFDAVYDLLVDGSYAYLLGAPNAGQTVFTTYDVTNLAAPVQVSSVSVPFLSQNFDVSGDLALVACLSNDVKIYDLTNHAQPPVLVSTFTGTIDARDVVAVGNMAFVADGTAGLITVDFSNPTSPTEVGRLGGIGQPRNIAAAYPYVVIVGVDPVLRIVNVGEPAEPFVADLYQTGGAEKIAIEGSTIATIASPGLLLLDAPILSTPSRVGVSSASRPELSIYPNPFNPTTTVSFSLSRATHVTLDVFDAAGRHVRTLTNTLLQAGQHRTTWDGRDEMGHLCASGVYFARLNAGVATETRKVVLVK